MHRPTRSAVSNSSATCLCPHNGAAAAATSNLQLRIRSLSLFDASLRCSLQCATAWKVLPSGWASAGESTLRYTAVGTGATELRWSSVAMPLYEWQTPPHCDSSDIYCGSSDITACCVPCRLVVIVMCMRQRVRGAFLVGILWVRFSLYSPCFHSWAPCVHVFCLQCRRSQAD